MEVWIPNVQMLSVSSEIRSVVSQTAGVPSKLLGGRSQGRDQQTQLGGGHHSALHEPLCQLSTVLHQARNTITAKSGSIQFCKLQLQVPRVLVVVSVGVSSAVNCCGCSAAEKSPSRQRHKNRMKQLSAISRTRQELWGIVFKCWRNEVFFCSKMVTLYDICEIHFVPSSSSKFSSSPVLRTKNRTARTSGRDKHRGDRDRIRSLKLGDTEHVRRVKQMG